MIRHNHNHDVDSCRSFLTSASLQVDLYLLFCRPFN
jgi:hypothetical protein